MVSNTRLGCRLQAAPTSLNCVTNKHLPPCLPSYCAMPAPPATCHPPPALQTVRILVNTPAAQGAIGDIYNFHLDPSLTLGCGSWGSTSVSTSEHLRCACCPVLCLLCLFSLPL